MHEKEDELFFKRSEAKLKDKCRKTCEIKAHLFFIHVLRMLTEYMYEKRLYLYLKVYRIFEPNLRSYIEIKMSIVE